MGREIYIFQNFIEKNNIEDEAEISKEEIFSYLISETKFSLTSIRNSIYFFITLGFLSIKDKKTYIFHKTKFDEFFKKGFWMPADTSIRAIKVLKKLLESELKKMQKRNLQALVATELGYSSITSIEAMILFLEGNEIILCNRMAGFTQILFDSEKAKKFINANELALEKSKDKKLHGVEKKWKWVERV